GRGGVGAAGEGGIHHKIDVCSRWRSGYALASSSQPPLTTATTKSSLVSLAQPAKDARASERTRESSDGCHPSTMMRGLCFHEPVLRSTSAVSAVASGPSMSRTAIPPGAEL